MDMENGQETQASQAPEDTQEQKPQIVVGKPVHKHWATWILALLLILSLAGNGFLWMQLQKTQEDLRSQRASNQSLQDQVEKLKSQVGGEDAIGENPNANPSEAACAYTSNAAFKDNIKAALDSKNTAAFASYVTNPVRYVLAASEEGGDASPDEAASSLAYTHSATGPWEYVAASDYSSGDYAQYFDKKAVAIKSADGMVVAFDFTCDGDKITSIFVAPSEEML
jgi:cell division protein FtsB